MSAVGASRRDGDANGLSSTSSNPTSSGPSPTPSSESSSQQRKVSVQEDEDTSSTEPGPPPVQEPYSQLQVAANPNAPLDSALSAAAVTISPALRPSSSSQQPEALPSTEIPAKPLVESYDSLEHRLRGRSRGRQRSSSLPPKMVTTTRKLRRGKWTVEEEAYVARVIQDFNSGYLDAPAGTTLRTYLSEKLQCDPMRITKKFTGDACIGKRVFHPAVRSPANTEAIDKAQVRVYCERCCCGSSHGYRESHTCITERTHWSRETMETAFGTTTTRVCQEGGCFGCGSGCSDGAKWLLFGCRSRVWQ